MSIQNIVKLACGVLAIALSSSVLASAKIQADIKHEYNKVSTSHSWLAAPVKPDERFSVVF
jgi:hypothetical protein